MKIDPNQKTGRLAILLLALALPSLLHAQSGTWTQTTSGGLWSTTGNWLSGIVADGSGATADFSQIDITAAQIVHGDASHTLTALLFGNTDPSPVANWILDDNGSGGANILTLAGSSPGITVNNLGGGEAATISAVMAGSTAWSKSGPGNLILSGSNTLTANINITGGQLTLANPANLNSGTVHSFTIGSGATLSIAYGGTVSGTTFASSFGSGITILGNGTLEFDPGAGLGLGLVNASGGATVYFGMTGGLININSGVVNNGGYTSQNWTTNKASMNIAAGATFNVWNGAVVYIDALTGAGSLIDTESAGQTINIGVNNGSGEFDGNIGGLNNLYIVKTGTGTENFTGMDTNPSPINVNGGTLLINGNFTAAFNTNNYNVNAGGTLGGTNGIIGHPTYVYSGGRLGVGLGASIGTLSFSNMLTFSAGSTNLMGITKTGGTNASDLIAGFSTLTSTGILSYRTLTFAGTLVVTNITTDSSALAAGDTFQLFGSFNFSGSFNNFVLPALPAGLSWDTTQLATAGFIRVYNSTTAALPVFNPPTGGYVGPQVVTITCITPGATIYYTTNGTQPTLSSPSGPSGLTITLPANTPGVTIEAYCHETGFADSATVIQSYQTVPTAFWTNPVGGSWATAGNWLNNVLGNGAYSTVDFSTLTLSGLADVTLDGMWTNANLRFGDVGNTYGWEIDSGTGGPLTLAGPNSTITVSNQTLTVTAALAGNSNLTEEGNGTNILSGANTFTGNINVLAGELEFASQANLDSSVSRTFSIASNAMLSISYGGPSEGQSYSSGFGAGITVVGNGTLQFDPGAGNYIGLVSLSGTPFLNLNMTGGWIKVNSGTLVDGGWQSQNWTNNLAGMNIASGAQFDVWNGAWVFIDALTGSGNIINGDAGGVGNTLNIGMNNGSGEFDGSISSVPSINLVKSGTGVESFTGSDTAPGSVTVNGGTLLISGNFSFVTNFLVNAGGALGVSGQINSPVVINSGGTLGVNLGNGVGTLTLANLLTLSPGSTNFMSITKTGGTTGSDLITGYATGTTFTGILVVTNITSGNYPLVAGDTFQLFNGVGAFVAFSQLVLPPLANGLSWDASQLATTGYLTVANTAAVPIFNPPAGGYVGAQTVTITSLTPGATIYYTTNGSTPTLSSPSGPSGLTVSLPANSPGLTIMAFASKANYTVSAVASALYSTVVVPTWTNPNGGSWATASDWSNSVEASGANVMADFSTLTLVSSPTYVTLDGVWTIGSLKFGDQANANGWEIDPGNSGTLTLAGTNTIIAVSNQSATITAVIAGTNSVTTTGPGTLILSGNNTFTGNINVVSGQLNLANAANLNNSITRTFNINSNATLNVQYGGSISGTTLGRSFGAGITVTGNGTLEFDPANGPNSGQGLGLINSSGGARFNLGMTGGLININSGIVINGGYANQNWSTNLASMNIAAGATFNAWDGGVVYVDALTGAGLLTDTQGAKTVNIGVNNGSGVFSGSIGGNNAITLTKVGTGTETFTGVDTNAGPINVNNGAVYMNGSTTPTNLLTVATGAILGGAGTIGNRVNVAVGGFLAPGASPTSFGTLGLTLGSTNTLVLNGNTLLFSLASVANYDQITNAGTLVLNGANIVQLIAPAGTIPAGTYTLMTYSNKVGSGTLALQVAYPNATLTVGATNMTLNVTVPTYVPGDVWQGAVSGVWDGNSMNWTRNGIGSSAFVAGDGVTFDDTAVGNFTVGSGSLTLPSSVTFNNFVNNYTVSAAIGGSGPVVKNGTGMLILSGANTYTNTTTHNSGTLRFLGGSALPAATAINLGPGTLQILNDGVGSGGSISLLGNTITLSGAYTTDIINVGNNGSGNTGNIVAFGGLFNGTPLNSLTSTINFTAANGYLMSFGILGLPGNTGATTTLNPTTTSVIIGNVTNQNTSFGGHYDTLTLGGTSTGNMITGVIADSGGYESIGNGDTRITMSGVAWTLSGTNTYHGPTSVTSGTLTIGGAGELGAGYYTGAISISSGATLNYASSASQAIAGVNTGSGTLLISSGELLGVTGGGCSNNPDFVAAGATNGVLGGVFGVSWACSNLTYRAGTTYLDINFGSSYPSTTAAPLLVNGNLTNNGTLNLIVRSSVGIGAGTYPLLKYTGVTNGPLPATAMALPAGMVGIISNDVANKSLDLIVTTAGTGPLPLAWAVGNGTWDVNASANWKDLNGLTGDYYTGGNEVTFDDTASGASPIAVTLNSIVSPASCIVNATNKSYTISGSGGIAGATGLTKNGTNTLTLGGVNTYTNVTTINAGKVQFAGASALSGASAINLGAATLQILNDGTGSGGTIGLGNNITLTAGVTTDIISVGNNGSGHTGNTVAFGTLYNSTPAFSSAANFNFLGANGYLISFSSLALPGATGNNTLLNPTNTSLIIGNVVNQEMLVFSGHYDNLYLGGNSTGNVITGVISDSSGYTSIGNGDTRITMQGIGWMLSGTNTFHGPISVNSGTLTIGGVGELGVGNYAGTISIATNSALNYASSASQIFAGVISGSGSLTNVGGPLTLTATNTFTNSMTIGLGSTLTIGGAGKLGNGVYPGPIINNGAFNYASSGNQTNSGVISGTGSLTNAGPGTLTLSGANTYTGNTTVNGGTLVITAPTLATNSTVTVNNSALLKLTFAVTNQVTAIVLNGVPQAPGVYNSGNTPLITGTGSLLIPSNGPGIFANPTGITSFSLSGANVVITGTNGQAGDAYYLLTSTNLALPRSQWQPVATNVPGSSGNYTFTATNAVFFGALQQFYILSNTNF